MNPDKRDKKKVKLEKQQARLDKKETKIQQTMANYKNSLQEKFQRLQLGLPTYDSRQTEVGWVATVELCNGSTFTGSELITKVGSEQDAARQALKYFEGHLAEFHTDGLLEEVLARPSWSSIDNASQIWIVIDLENVGSEKEMIKLQQLKSRGFIVSGYASANYRNADKAKKYLDPHVHIDDSDLSEVADVRIVMDITQALIEDDFKLIFIISYDRFARAAAEVFQLDIKGNRYPGKPAISHCRTVDQVLMQLKRD
jgi:hypothetical protein